MKEWVWTMVVLFGLLLYLMTLPFVQFGAMKMSKTDEHAEATMPTWVFIYAMPANFLYRNTPLDGAMDAYHQWCYTWLGEPEKW